MSNRLEYSLGLSTSSFQAGIIAANQGLELFKKGLGLVGDIGQRAFETIAHGRALRDLSARTGEGVGNLFQLEKAFKESGVSGDNVATVLFRFQKSLSGVGEMGESTTEAFAALGVSMADLARMDAPEAMLRVFEGLNKLDRNSATGVAATIFGRGAAGDFLQLARNSKDFAESIEHSAKMAALFEKNAEIFTQIDKNIIKLKNSFKYVWAQVADEIAPSLNGIFAGLANRDVPMFAKVLELSLTVAFENSVNFFANALAKVFAALPGLIKGVAMAGVATIGAPLIGGFARWMAGQSELEAKLASGSPALAAQKRKDAIGWRLFGAAADTAGPEAALKAGEFFVESIKKGLAAGGIDLFAGGHGALLKGALSAMGLLPGPRPLPNAGGFTGQNLGEPLKIEANPLEKVGALFGNGGGNDLSDSARKTASNTAKLVQQQAELIRWLREQNRDPVVHNL